MISYSALATLAAAALITMFGESIAPADDIAIRVYVITFVTSLLVEMIGLAPRILWVVPLWLVALAMFGVHIYTEHGVLGVAGVVLAGAVLLVLTILVGRFHTRRRERRDLAKAMRSVDIRGLNPIYDQAWETLHEAVLCPRETAWTKELCAHNRKVAQIAAPWLLDRNPTPARAKRLQQLDEVFVAGLADPSDDEALLGRESDWLQAMIRDRDSLDREEVQTEPLSARIDRMRKSNEARSD